MCQNIPEGRCWVAWWDVLAPERNREREGERDSEEPKRGGRRKGRWPETGRSKDQ